MTLLNFFYVLNYDNVNTVANTNTFHPCYIRLMCISFTCCLFNDFNRLYLFDISSKRWRLWYLLGTFLFISFKRLSLVKLGYRFFSQHLTKQVIWSLYFSTFSSCPFNCNNVLEKRKQTHSHMEKAENSLRALAFNLIDLGNNQIFKDK